MTILLHIIVTQNCDPQIHPHYAVLMVKFVHPLQTLPEPLYHLFVGDTAESRCFQNNIPSYNSVFAFASLGVNEDMLPAGYTILE